MIFEYDAAKSQTNRIKHGIDFVEAQHLWSDVCRLEVPAITRGEPRYLVIGTINQKYWSAIITYRGTNIRIISVRRSRPNEIKYYEKNQH